MGSELAKEELENMKGVGASEKKLIRLWQSRNSTCGKWPCSSKALKEGPGGQPTGNECYGGMGVAEGGEEGQAGSVKQLCLHPKNDGELGKIAKLGEG